jgi:ABC-2 type transport system ATP-binding protein
MKKKLALACTLIHIPELILLDEPTTGVDPVSRRDFWKILSSLRKTGLTIIMTTPYLDEAERCSKIGLIYRGRIIAEGEPSAINESFPLQMVEYTCTPRDTALQIFKKSTLIKELSVHGGKIHAAYDDAERGITEAAEVLERNAVLWSSRRISPSLEDIFIYLIEQQTEQ